MVFGKWAGSSLMLGICVILRGILLLQKRYAIRLSVFSFPVCLGFAFPFFLALFPNYSIRHVKRPKSDMIGCQDCRDLQNKKVERHTAREYIRIECLYFTGLFI